MVGVKTEMETPLGRKLRIALLTSAGVFMAVFAVLLIFYRSSPPGEWLIYLLGISLATAVAMGLIRFAHVLFAELQAPLSELLLTFLVAGGAMTLTRSLYAKGVDEPYSAIIFMVLLTLAVLLGSIWGWSAAKRLDETQTRRRICLLALGWLLVPGVVAAASVVLTTVISLFEGSFTSPFRADQFWIFYIGSALTSVLAVPALYCERRISKHMPESAPGQLDTTTTERLATATSADTDRVSNLTEGHPDRVRGV